MQHRTVLIALLLGGCTFAAPSNDPGLPGVAATSSTGARAPFVRMMLGIVRGELASWEAAVRGAGRRPLIDHYASGATVIQPGGDAVKQDGVVALSDSLPLWASDAVASQLDADVSEGIAYVYGAYEFMPRRAGTAGSRGRHVTVFRGNEQGWHIRLQLFVPNEATAFPGIPADLEPGMMEYGTTATGSVPVGAVQGVLRTVAELRRLWEEKDVRGLRRLLTADALVHFPENEVAARGDALAGALQAAMERYDNLQTVELDFTASGRIAAVLGRYVARADGAFAGGPYALVLVRDGNTWRIRSLLLG